jgi:hypothetical protein
MSAYAIVRDLANMQQNKQRVKLYVKISLPWKVFNPLRLEQLYEY